MHLQNLSDSANFQTFPRLKQVFPKFQTFPRPVGTMFNMPSYHGKYLTLNPAKVIIVVSI